MKFLIVDDNEPMRETLRKMVAQENDEIMECNDGGDAPGIYEQFHPDWVVMDVVMKDVGGLEATERIVALDPHARVIMISSYTDRFFQEAAKKAGARAFVSKENLSELKSMTRSIT